MDPLASARQLFLDALALHEQGDLERAECLYKEALALAPERPSVMNNLAAVYVASGKLAEAMALCRKLLQVNPRDEVALLNQGSCQLKSGSAGEALASYDGALQIRPDYADALSGRGGALLGLGRLEEALASCERALAVEPDHAETLNNRGHVLLKLRRPEEALASFERALAKKPGYVEALYNRGANLLELNRPAEALESYDRALAGNPDHVEALNNRGIALLELRRPEEALTSFDRALAIKPDYAEALGNRGLALLVLNRREEFIEGYKRLLDIKPDYIYAPGHLLTAQMQGCEWSDYETSAARILEGIRAGKRADTPFSFLAISDSAADQLQCSRMYVADKYPAAPRPVWRGERYRHDRIRIAYLSADFHAHATANLMAGLFEAHDRTRFETTAISFGPDIADEMRTRLRAAFDRFIDVRDRSGHETASLLRELEIDIAVDLKGYTAFCRTEILSHRAAPIQVNYLGYPGTMGADYIDYILADRLVIPEQHHSFYTEKVVYLPDTYQANDSRRQIAEWAPTRAEAGLPEQGFVFCSFNNNYKITPKIFDVWMRLLQRTEGSVLWLLEDNAAAARNLRREAEHRGVAPQRLVFAPRLRLDKHLARHRLADLFLDTLPCNAHTTASDALWAGLPVLTCLGTTFAGRVAASLLHAIGLNELVTHSLEEYEALALELAANRKRLDDIRSRLAANRATHPLFDTDRFRRHIEAAYTKMWERHQRGEPPASFSVPAAS
ncbi:MAG TPA: tetratricopeptide repeat protein [Burkholderiales bacterium]|nr:tetratricopeptide repeat protein [Burkholderiales bacterium]